MSEWKQGAAARRDARATKDEPESHKRHARKNTKRWCRGRKGRDHQTVTVAKWEFWRHTYVVDKCLNCGKEMRLRDQT